MRRDEPKPKPDESEDPSESKDSTESKSESTGSAHEDDFDMGSDEESVGAVRHEDDFEMTGDDGPSSSQPPRHQPESDESSSAEAERIPAPASAVGPEVDPIESDTVILNKMYGALLIRDANALAKLLRDNPRIDISVIPEGKTHSLMRIAKTEARTYPVPYELLQAHVEKGWAGPSIPAFARLHAALVEALGSYSGKISRGLFGQTHGKHGRQEVNAVLRHLQNMSDSNDITKPTHAMMLTMLQQIDRLVLHSPDLKAPIKYSHGSRASIVMRVVQGCRLPGVDIRSDNPSADTANYMMDSLIRWANRKMPSLRAVRTDNGVQRAGDAKPRSNPPAAGV